MCHLSPLVQPKNELILARLEKSRQALTNESGQQTAVVLPIEHWKELGTFFKKRNDFTAELKASVREGGSIVSGQAEGRPSEELWDELPD